MISEADHRRIADAIHAAEAKTSAELVCVVARASSDYATMPIVWSALGALALPWLLMLSTDWSVARILIAQLALFAGLLLVLSVPAIRVALVPAPLRRSHAHRAALEQFVIRGLHRKPDRTGVLVFVSLAERFARIVADTGVAARVPEARWQEAVDMLIHDARDGRVTDGFVAAVGRCGDILADAFPRGPENRDELPDRIYVLD